MYLKLSDAKLRLSLAMEWEISLPNMIRLHYRRPRSFKNELENRINNVFKVLAFGVA
jgi:hypothetical protein